MSELKLFKIEGQRVHEIPSRAIGVEKSLQAIFEQNLDTLLGVKFLATEYTTGKSHNGRIDTLGIDENGSPVITEYKRAISESVVSQGLFYLDWLVENEASFKLLVIEKIGTAKAKEIDFSVPRLICIASDFTKYDIHAVNRINQGKHSVDLIRYRRFAEDLLVLELVNREVGKVSNSKTHDKPIAQWLKELKGPIREIYEELRPKLLALGDDVEEMQLKLYTAYRRIKNFACIVIQKKAVILYLSLPPKTVPMEEGFIRDVSGIGHWATGDVEITITSMDQLRKIESLLSRAYEDA
jgi:predicted transport protein